MIAAPLLLWRVSRHAARSTVPGRRWRERLGWGAAFGGEPIWIHAASVGEVQAAAGLVDALLDGLPGRPLVLSTFTLTGAARARSLWGDRIAHRLAPIDTWPSTRRWLRKVKPALAIVVETEIWPELFCQINRRGIPLVLVNARLSERGSRRLARWPGLFAPALKAVDQVLAQSRVDGLRFAALGVAADRIRITGNLKFDLKLPADLEQQAQSLRRRWSGRPSWVAGSTHAEEEAVVVAAHRELLEQHRDGLLVLAPRHPERVSAIDRELVAAGLRGVRLDQPADNADVVVVDRMGSLLACYAGTDAAFVGGSLVRLGGHNLLEPAACARPVISGPHLDNQRDAAAALERAGALIRVDDAGRLAAAVAELWREPEKTRCLGEAARSEVERGRGSLASTLDHLNGLLHLPTKPVE